MQKHPDDNNQPRRIEGRNGHRIEINEPAGDSKQSEAVARPKQE